MISIEVEQIQYKITDDPLISIVLPTYNGSNFLGKSIQSCLDQTYCNWELIIVDDASKDNTPDIIAHYVSTDARIKAVRHESNRKLPTALNTGFALAKGEYLTWTSDDNLYRPQAVSKMISLLQSKPRIDIVYADYVIIDESETIIRKIVQNCPEELVLGNCIGPCFLYRRKVQEKLGGYAEDMFLAEDYDFWLRASVLFRFYHLPDDLYIYRHHNTSLTSVQSQAIVSMTEHALEKNLPNLHWMNNTKLAEAYLKLHSSAGNRKDILSAKKYILKALGYSPNLVISKAIVIKPKLVKRQVLKILGKLP